jgi:hypothetical protein
MDQKRNQTEKHYMKPTNPLRVVVSVVLGIILLAVFSIGMSIADMIAKWRRKRNAHLFQTTRSKRQVRPQ